MLRQRRDVRRERVSSLPSKSTSGIKGASKLKHGLEFLVGVEIEFYILDESKDVLPTGSVKTNSSPFSAASLHNGSFGVQRIEVLQPERLIVDIGN